MSEKDAGKENESLNPPEKPENSENGVHLNISADSIGPGSAIGVSASVTAGLISGDRYSLREWWHSIIRKYGQTPCCAFLLALPADKAAIEYFSEYGNELHILSGKYCLVVALSDEDIKSGEFNNQIWSEAVNEHIAEGYSLLISRYFGISPTDFPCLVVFEDIRSTEHLLIPLKKLSVEDIAITMRRVFYTVQQAGLEQQNPLIALQSQQASEKLGKLGRDVILTVRSAAEKTFETALEVLIRSTMGA